MGQGYERSLILDTIDEARAAERAGFSTWWQVEHHGTPEFSHSSAPELLLTAIAIEDPSSAYRARRRARAVSYQRSVAGGGARRRA